MKLYKELQLEANETQEKEKIQDLQL